MTQFILSLADQIQLSRTTHLLLSMKGGFIMEDRGLNEIKVSLIKLQLHSRYYFLPLRNIIGTYKHNVQMIPFT